METSTSTGEICFHCRLAKRYYRLKTFKKKFKIKIKIQEQKLKIKKQEKAAVKLQNGGKDADALADAKSPPTASEAQIEPALAHFYRRSDSLRGPSATAASQQVTLGDPIDAVRYCWFFFLLTSSI
jgi:hypothetical protein